MKLTYLAIIDIYPIIHAAVLHHTYAVVTKNTQVLFVMGSYDVSSISSCVPETQPK